MVGIDISNYQKDLGLSSFEYDFAIVKATEGTTYVSPSLTTFTDQLTKLDKLMGFYHFARPDLSITTNTSRMAQEAYFFLRTLEDRNLLGKGILVLDWERLPYDDLDAVSKWLEIVESESGNKPFIYGSLSKLKTYFMPLLHKYPVWIGRWPTGDEIPWGVLPEGYATKDFSYEIWQYTSNGKIPGFEGRVDFNVSSLSKEEWLRYAGYIKEETISEAMHWAINNGLFVGYGDGTYRPQDYLTREQLAIVLKKFHDKVLDQVNVIIDANFGG